MADNININYLKLLSKSFPTIADASTEIINLQAILNLPKGTEHFLADLHGEHEAFQHVLKNASGSIKRKVNALFDSTLRENEIRDLCTLIYYPEQKLKLVRESETNYEDWLQITIHRLISVCRDVSSKYTRSKVRKALPPEFSYIIQELLHERTDDANKTAYINGIIRTIITTGCSKDFIIAICNVIQRLAIDQLHILGDIYDRGPGAHIILDTLAEYKGWDIEWGNHDILWMGALAGNDACICNVLRISLRYANMTTLEDGYGINLMPLATFALETYGDDPCAEFMPRLSGNSTNMDDKTRKLIAKMHKAISVIQFKVEAQLIDRHPEWQMDDRKLFEAIDYANGMVNIDGKEYKLLSNHFPTVNPACPNKLTEEEENLMNKLHHSFRISDKLRSHIRMMLQHGHMFSVVNNNLMYHASIPLNEDGSLKDVEVTPGNLYRGPELLYQIDNIIHYAFRKDAQQDKKEYAIDYFLYLWCGPDSPLFDKKKMATFERYFLAEKETHKEEKGYYFKLRDREEVVDNILNAFGVNGTPRHIINGHVPVHVADGEMPVKANGKLMVIDGGFARAYHKETGIAGFTLVYHSRGFDLVQHELFTNTEDAILNGTDIKSTRQMVETSSQRMLVANTDIGKDIYRQIEDLNELLAAYRKGIIKEQETNVTYNKK